MAQRQIILDTETTGMPAKDGHRIIEIGCVEMIDRKTTGSTFWKYLNPEGKAIDPDAERVHGIKAESLRDKPTFREIAREFVDFVRGAELIIHNADFDVDFLNAELERAGMPKIWDVCPDITCSLKMAQSLFPGQKNNLDALCKRHAVDNSGRELHGALLDSQLLAEVYVKMTENAPAFVDDEALAQKKRAPVEFLKFKPALKTVIAAPQDIEAHEALLGRMAEQTNVTPVYRARAKM